nr:response regulator [uncultured Methanoregula sp.]
MYELLYVDDDQNLLESSKIYLERKSDFLVTTASSAMQGLDLLKTRSFDAIISDYQMAGMDGISFLKEVRAKYDSVPFIILTGKGREEVVIEAINNGADFYLQKGGSPKAQFAELIHMLMSAVRRRRSEVIIRTNEERLRMAQAIGKTGSWEYNPKTGTFWGSEETFRTLGIPRPDDGMILQDTLKPVIHDASRIYTALLDHIERDKKFTLEISVSPANGSPETYIETVAEVLRDTSGKPVNVIGVIKDITEQKKAEDDVRIAGEWFCNIFQTSPIAIEIFNSKGSLLDINPACCALFGIDSIEEVRGFNLFSDPNIPVSEKDLLISGKTIHYETDFDFDLIKKLGLYGTSRAGRITIDVLISPVMDREGIIARYLVQVVDITDRKKAEDALRRSNRQLNLLLSITRHDIRNQLITLNGYIALARCSLGDREKALEFLKKEEKIVAAINRQITFTKEYQELGINPPVWQNIQYSIRQALKSMNPGGILLEMNGLEETEILADSLLDKVFFNLVDNALWHGGETLTTVKFFPEKTGSGLILVCEDDGAGISNDDKENIFVRGYGKNTGYGLFLIREILGITGIAIRETGTPGKGARFEMAVPEGIWRTSGKGE